jgi:hypothetical protein
VVLCPQRISYPSLDVTFQPNKITLQYPPKIIINTGNFEECKPWKFEPLKTEAKKIPQK